MHGQLVEWENDPAQAVVYGIKPFVSEAIIAILCQKTDGKPGIKPNA